MTRFREMFFLRNRKTRTNDKKLVYFIACHKNPNQVLRLIRAIYRRDNLYFINIDKKSPADFYKEIVSSEFKNYENIFFSRKRVDWGKWNQVQAVLDAIKKALSFDGAWTHFINLSGQDFPLKSQEKIQAYLLNQRNKSFLNARHCLPDTDMANDRFSFRIKIGGFSRIYKRLDLSHPEIKFYKGSQWVILSRDFCKYADDSDFSGKIKPWFKKFFIPDESFFPTLAANGKLSSDIVWENKRFIKWAPDARHPELLNLNNLAEIVSSQAFFARKFDESINIKMIDELEKLLEK